MALTQQEVAAIGRARQIAGLSTAEEVKDYTGITDDFRACARALADAQEVLAQVAGIAEREA